MPRRFALALLALLVMLLVAFLLGRSLKSPTGGGPKPTPTARPTAIVPPTPIAGQKVSLFFEGADEAFHPEARELPASTDEIALLRSIAAAVLDGPRRSELLRPFPTGWRLRGAYRMRDGLVVLDLAPAVPRERSGPKECVRSTCPANVSTGSPPTSRTRRLTSGRFFASVTARAWAALHSSCEPVSQCC